MYEARHSFLKMDDLEGLRVEALPEIGPRFHVPALADKPHNPIMDTMRLFEERSSMPGSAVLPQELRLLTEDICAGLQRGLDINSSLWWTQAIRDDVNTIKLKTWDSLRPTFDHHTSPSPFLSEQASHAFAAARYYIRPSLNDPTAQIVYVTPSELFKSLKTTLTGISSTLYIWNAELQLFRLRSAPSPKKGVIVVVGMDEIASTSFVRRFITIGTLIRRIEILISEERRSYRSDEPISHALMHGLSSVLAYSRNLLNKLPLATEDLELDEVNITMAWAQYAELEELLKALATFCHREEHLDPSQYEGLPRSIPGLLSHVYQTLQDHYSKQAPKMVVAIFAFILMVTSRDYFRKLGQSVGYGDVQHLSGKATQVQPVVDGGPASLDEQPEEDKDEDALQELVENEHSFPTFVDPTIAEALPRARRSLTLLQRAQPDHPLLNRQTEDTDISWFWTHAEVEAAWRGSPIRVARDNLEHDVRSYAGKEETQATLQSHPYPPEMKAFFVFDLPPGVSIDSHRPRHLTAGDTSYATLQSFIDAFPATLPSITPTLSHLSSLVLSPLVQHCEALSRALVDLFLLPSSYFNLHAHLVLLRSYLLITSDSFKLHLRGALFSDSDDYEAAPLGSRAFTRRSRSRSRKESNDPSNNEGPWAVGISSTLTKGKSWPPGGTDLGFNLRTVIIESLGRSHEREATGHLVTNKRSYDSANRRILEEAEYRLGFALRDLPVGMGKAKWLNPVSIEAMDFLYMDYRAPHPLDVVMSPIVLSKYHRLFTFNLRLMRVENALSSLFRMTRRASEPLFKTLSASNQLLLHFRFVAQSFVTSLSSYIYDTAIGGNYDAFLAQVKSESQSSKRTFSDVFALADRHDAVMDDILSSCLLRSSQRAVSDSLRTCLQIVLDLCILAGEMKRGRLQEYEAAPRLEDLWRRFCRKIGSTVKSLRAMVDKGAGSARLPLEAIHLQGTMGPLSQVEGLTRDLHNLLIRLDTSDWWTNHGRS